MDSTFDLLTLALLPGGPASDRRRCGRGVAVSELLARPAEHPDLISEAARRALADGTARRAAEAELARARRMGFAVVGRDEPVYPRLLREIFDPPPVLYVQGRLAPEAGEPSVAIVGARAATPAGAALARSLAAELASAGCTIVSGLARGIDSAAHRGALATGGRSVAVLGSGLDRPYPAENTPLVAQLAERGAVVSEFPLGTEPRPGHFPRRNRILAGWGLGVVVVEAAARSGALITASLALEAGREVMAVPGHPTWPGSAGTNALIRDGARLVRDAADVALELGFEIRPCPGATGPGGLLEVLPVDKPATLEELSERSGRPLADLRVELAELELAARVRRLPGPLFLRN